MKQRDIINRQTFLRQRSIANGLTFGAVLVAIGLLLQSVVGAIDWGVLSWPVNVAVMIVYLCVLLTARRLRRRIGLFRWLGGGWSAVTSLIWAAAMTVVMGLIRQDGSEGGVIPGFADMITSWSFVLVYLWMTTSLGLAILTVRPQPTFGYLTFLLNHLGLFVVLTGATLGAGDTARLTMTIGHGSPEWRALDDESNMVELPFAVERRESTGEAVTLHTHSGQTIEGTLRVNHPLSVDGWKLYPLGHDEAAGLSGDVVIIAPVRDPRLPIVYCGFIMMAFGAVGMFVFNRRL